MSGQGNQNGHGNQGNHGNQNGHGNQGDHGTQGDHGHQSDPPCFMEGTLIQTPSGEVRVETLKAGDLVVLVDGAAAPVRWLGRSTVSARVADPLRVLPVRIKAGALADNAPHRDLLVSPGHALLVDNILIEASALVNGTSILLEEQVPATFTYYHVELERHAVILAEGAPAESFVDNTDRFVFDNWAEHEALHPEVAPIEEMAYPRAKSRRQVPSTTLARLAALDQTLHTRANAQAA